MNLEIVTYGDPRLRKKAERVDDPTRFASLVADMLETLQASNGLGLAAQQVGHTESLCIVDIPPSYDVKEENGLREHPDVQMPLIMFNPEITERAGSQTCQEGCLSFPEIFVPIKRDEEVAVSYQDPTGKHCSVRVRGLASRAAQHELDHLAGVLLVDRMSPVKRISLAGKLKRLRKETLERADS